MEDADTADQAFKPGAVASSYPTLAWERSEPQEFWHGSLYIHEKIQPSALIQSALKDSRRQTGQTCSPSSTASRRTPPTSGMTTKVTGKTGWSTATPAESWLP